MAELSALMSICPPPPDPPPLRTGRSASVGVRTPDGHSEMVKVYGTGCFDEFLWIFAEGAERENLDIAFRTAEAREIFRGKKMPLLREALSGLGCTPEELIQWGVTDNGDSLLWIPVGNPDDWSTVVLQAGQLDFSIFSKSSTGLIFDLLSGSLRLRIFPEDFPSPHPEFSPDPYA
ncbi:hypothetical protein [Streptomyces sp. MMBL 11-3]|uniref:hypothetical protein n=1 Tax=Streptomyces sp. MMBL 11-3 TaxID=3382639 RepID=UPI0039B53A28